VKIVNGDIWPDRDVTCSRVAYEFDGADKAIKRCKNRGVAIQAGGNVGVWPRYFKKHFDVVYTFEPSDENYYLMVRNLGKTEVLMFHGALLDYNGECSIKTNPRNNGDDRTSPGTGTKVYTIDSFSISPDLIYLDIQGDEYLALKGALNTLERCNPVVAIEVDNKLSRSKGNAVEFLESIGYRKTGEFKQDQIFER